MNTPTLQEMPTLTAEPSARTTPPSEKIKTVGYPKTGLVLTGLLFLLLSTLISGAFTLIGKNQLLVWLGEKPATAQPDKNAIAIEELTSQLKLFSQILDDMELEKSKLAENADRNSNDLAKLTQRVTNVERFTSDLEQRIVEQKKVQERQIATKPKSVMPEKLKPTPIIPIVLVSIRTQAGISFVALRDGLDNSELLMPGDSWRGWTLLSADPATNSARFRVAGTEQELRL